MTGRFVGVVDDEKVRRHKELLQALRDRPGAIVPRRLAFFWVEARELNVPNRAIFRDLPAPVLVVGV